MRRVSSIAACLGLLALFLFAGQSGLIRTADVLPVALGQQVAAGAGDTANPFPNRSPAPSLEGGVGWLNTSGPIDLKDLRGKVVLLDFWTYCCINCMHVLPDLEALEAKYPNELVVIGVHSAKFENEKDSEAIRAAVLRYGIRHPVINDANMTVWRKFGTHAWPTVVLIDPEGNYCGYVSGEGNLELLDTAVAKLVDYHAAKKTLDRSPVHFDLEQADVQPTPLRFPGKVLADEAAQRGDAAGRIYISDSNHNRIVVTTADGGLVETIGAGSLGRADGAFTQAQFDHPQGLALDGQTLYVADTENHLIRTVDLRNKRVSTLAGTGQQAAFREAGGPLRRANLNSPWDLQLHNGGLYVAMAGSHQIWLHRLGSDSINVFAGSGREDIVNGPHLQAAFAQPSGLAADTLALYVCDSEGSSIRRVPFDTGWPVTTVAGTSNLPNGASLFEFGDQDGVGAAARLQHPLGITRSPDGTLYVADSYNHKIKAIRLSERGLGTVTTLVGTGTAGDGQNPLQLSEPAGLTMLGDMLLVADTNNQRLLKVDPAKQSAVVFDIAGLEPPRAVAAEQPSPTAGLRLSPAPPTTVAAAAAVPVQIKLSLPEGYKLNPDYPLVASVGLADRGGNAAVLKSAEETRIKAQPVAQAVPAVEFTLPLSGTLGTANVRIGLTYGYCREGTGGLCKLGRAAMLLPLTVAADGATSITIAAPPAE